MPKKTFMNLTDEQQLNIIEASIKEFSEHDYNSASLNNIIASLDVTKGSFYRYFESKNDLYDYLIEYAADKKSDFIKSNFDIDSDEFFNEFKNIMYAYIKFDLTYPIYGRFLFNVKYFDNQSGSSVNIYKFENTLKVAIEKGINAGILDSCYNVEFIYHCIVKVVEGLELYLKRNFSFDNLPDLNYKKLDEEFIRFINFLKSGFGTKIK